MSPTTTYCASGCTNLGDHRADCLNLCRHVLNGRSCPRACDGTCRGCSPRLAEHGTLCPWCYGQLTRAVHETPGVVWHLCELGRPMAQAAPPSDLRVYRDPAEGNVRPAPWDAADELHAALASWAHLLLEEHPDGHRMAGPDEADTTRAAGRKVLDPHTFPPLPGEPDVWPRPSEVAGITDPAATYRLASWLLPHLPWIAGQEWAAEMRREMGDMIATSLARWPRVDTREKHVGGVRCVRCGRESLVYAPPNFPGASARISCSHPECGRIYTEAELDGALGRLAAERGYVA